MKKNIKILMFFVLVLFMTFATSCLGLKKHVGKTKFEMLNKIGTPSRILNSSNGEQIYVYFYEDYSQNHYPSVVGFMYIDKNEKVYKVEKYNTRLSLDEFLQYR
jgi:hypothetical protein